MSTNGQPKEMKYTIGDKVFYQLPLSLGQVEHLIKALGGIDLAALTDVNAVIGLLGAKLPEALACVLIPEGLKRRDFLDTLDQAGGATDTATFLHAEIGIDVVTQVIMDFFECNPLATLVETLTPLATTVGAPLSRLMSLKDSMPSSVEETHPNGMPSAQR